MSIRRNIVANYISQIYITLIGIVMLPVYLKYMGAEAYGLVGFFSMLQAWFNLLDMGLTPTMARETARFRGGATDALSYRRLVRALEGVFLIVALAGGVLLFSAAGFVASDWLQASQLPIAAVKLAVQLMAIIVVLRWMCGLYRGAISGSEHLVWLGGYNSLFATLRFIGVLPVLLWVGVTPTIFFSYQLAVAVLEMLGLMFYAYRLLPAIPQGKPVAWSWSPLKPVLKFSLTIAFTSSVWIMVTQTDKLVLSKLLPLAEYGYFTLAVLVAGVVMVISGPVSGAIMPRMSKLEAEGDHEGLIRLYRQATQMVAIIALPLAFVLAAFAEPVLWAWTGDQAVAKNAAPILRLYALGNGVMVISAFAYYLQYAKGNLRLHLVGSGLFLVVLIPALVWATMNYGGVGAGWAWLIANLLYFLVWVAVVHCRLEPGLNAAWLLYDVLIFAAVAGILAWEAFQSITVLNSRFGVVLEVFLVCTIVSLLTMLASKAFRIRLSILLRRF